MTVPTCRRWPAVLMPAVVVLIACGHPPQSGYVTQRDYKPAHSISHDDAMFVPICVGNPVICHQQLVGFNHWTERVPDRWWLRVKDDAGKHDEGWVPVDGAAYARYLPGQHWPDAR